MKITIKQLRQIIKEELQLLQEIKTFEDFPGKIQKLYKSRWADEVNKHRQKWEKTVYDALLKDENHFYANLVIFSTAEDYYEYEFGGPVDQIILNLTSTFYDAIYAGYVLDLLAGEWEAAVEYFENTEEGREIESYMRGLVNFAWAVATGEMPDSPYSSKLSEMAKIDVESMVSAYGLYESLI